MSTKSDLLDKINRKAEKIRERKLAASTNILSVETAVFDFFKRIEEARQMNNNLYYDSNIFGFAKDSLKQRIQSFDHKAKISVEYNSTEDLEELGTEIERPVLREATVRGVTIWWGEAYIKKNQVDPSLYIDVSQTLFL